MSLKLNPLYKKLMAVIIVIAPMYWLTLTEDGRRRTELVVLSFMGPPALDMRLDTLSSAVNEQHWRDFFPEIAFNCEDRLSRDGNRTCAAPIGSFNGAPAHYILLHFADDALNTLQIAYRHNYHAFMIHQISHFLKQEPETMNNVLQWPTASGLILMPTDPGPENSKPSMLWLSAQATAARLSEAAQ
jgi:hypothetical protein